ncbi:hypothetical protein AM593_09789, partial [Mytilus galloprovincialis]
MQIRRFAGVRPPITPSNLELMLELPDEMIELGKELKLKCKSLQDVPPHKSRQWRGGEDNKLLCYDGVTIDSQKYKEEIKSSTAYELTVENLSENDLQCPYACRIGFDIDQKFLNVNEENFIHMPYKNATNLIYEQQHGTYRLSFELEKVYPKPVCMVIINGALRNLTVTDEAGKYMVRSYNNIGITSTICIASCLYHTKRYVTRDMLRQ